MLVYIFLALSLVGMSLLYVAFPALSLWYVLLLLPGFFLALNILYLLYLFLSSLFFSQKVPMGRDNPYCRGMMRLTLDWLLTLFRVHYHVSGAELLPKEPFVLVSNHRSDFDPMVTFVALPHAHLSYISKEGNFKIPIAGNYIYHTAFLPLDRENPMRAMRTLREGARLVREEGISVGIYPEGTRSRTNELLPFKEGAFVLAKKAAAPLVVMVTEHTEDIPHNLVRCRTDVSVRILAVIDRETVAEETTAELSARARALMEAALA